MRELGDLTSVAVEWDQPDYWDPQALDRELRRQYDVCNSCRLCFNLCPGFPRLFDHFDSEEVEADPARLTGGQVWEFVDLCYQCKLCFIKCPYTPPHKFLIDIPKLVLRARAVEARVEGVAWRDRILGSPDRIGQLAAWIAPLVNFANRARASRILLEKALGVHREKILPRFHGRTFARWFRSHLAGSRSHPAGQTKVALFHTCFVNHNEPRIGRAAVAVLRHQGIEVFDPPDQGCCGMPYLDTGRVDQALELFRKNVRSLRPFVQAGQDIVILEPTCGMMLKKEYLDYLRGEELEQAREVAGRAYDLCEYLVKLDREGRLRRDFVKRPGRVAYHQPCHLKYQARGNKSLELLRLTGAEVIFVDKGCSGHDGTWAMKKEYFDLSRKVAHGLHRGVNESRAEIVATDCSLAGLQIEQGDGRRAIHPIEVLAEAYGLDF